ncbi:MAG: ribonuclease HII [Bacteroidia bacterium]|nr:ribonuclease HII [Bacteroidia bacterium]MCZ2141474.1 ribonuclease HII [Bacteroidia bacterium]
MLKKYYDNNKIEAGCDEAGRGCLAGPVFAAAVILDNSNPIKGLNDSKKLNAKQRNELRIEIEERALSYAVAYLTNQEIDKYNILKASFMAMHKAINLLRLKPELLLIDGNRFIAYQNVPHVCIVKGDEKYQSIAAASILAKTYRDEFMLKAAEKFPQYKWNNNKGYPTKAHREAIKQYGTTPLHRLTFTLLNEQLSLSI